MQVTKWDREKKNGSIRKKTWLLYNSITFSRNVWIIQEIENTTNGRHLWKKKTTPPSIENNNTTIPLIKVIGGKVMQHKKERKIKILYSPPFTNTCVQSSGFLCSCHNLQYHVRYYLRQWTLHFILQFVKNSNIFSLFNAKD